MPKHPDWGGRRQGSGRKRQYMTVRVEALQALASNLQSLCNIAEMKAPHLVSDEHWHAARERLNEDAKRLGVDAWTVKAAEEFRQRIEEQEG